MPSITKAIATGLLALGLAGCNNIVPNDGPLLTRVVSEREKNDDFLYALVGLDGGSVKVLERHDYYPLSRTFGIGGRGRPPRLGVGDQLQVTIFEAGADGIFSTSEQKSVTVPLTVQGNGRISIPFAGSVRAAGRTPGQVRASVLAALQGRAVEPDVIVEAATVRSQTVTVNGEVRQARPVPLLLGTERILDVVSQAGGPTKNSYETYVSLSRNGKTRTALLQTLIERPSENIFSRPGDSLYLTHEPRRFVALGAVSREGRYDFESRHIDVLEAAAIAGGMEDSRSNPQAFFVFRHEYEHVLRHLCRAGYITAETLHRIFANEHSKDEHGRYPIVYRVDMSDPDNFFVAKRFPMRADDTLYVARKGIVDVGKILTLLSQATVTATGFRTITAD